MEGYDVWLGDFWRLSTERQIGFGYGPIPASAIAAHVSGWGDEDAHLFEHCIRALDRVFLMKANQSEDEPLATGSPMEAWRSATNRQREK
ncbi:hypothetical protein [Sphingopyxis macrogoltabida]|uniref:Uncharacterized protein n=1 Tax=Sphingopyxis macrogoltabida TaxID=33050 RepID=A0AAC8Z111_SPHMC|nr:hypothetical protein [Sphingopyxis macrogoltabida]ALJ12644.1 mevalonate kinase [Sphingopyxis macrogoltabida]AMU89888.1 hypothetical protein ATM17_12665 [Sphingopyxis macrogoltabida]